MTTGIHFSDLDDALRRCGSDWNAAQAHGLLCGRLAVRGPVGVPDWRDQLLANLGADNALRTECEALLQQLLDLTMQQLGERQSEFDLFLPDDDEDAARRTRAMADWTEGFLHGLVANKHSDAVKERLAAEPLSDVIKDMLEITRAGLGDDDDDEENEAAYAELVEYLRVAAQLAYEELADLRNPPSTASPASETLH